MDLRIENIFQKEMKGDTSFTNEGGFLSGLFGRNYYSSSEMKDTWNLGIKHGIEIGLRNSSIKGQKIELQSSAITEKQKEFLNKFYALSNEYNISINYHPIEGMMVLDQSK